MENNAFDVIFAMKVNVTQMNFKKLSIIFLSSIFFFTGLAQTNGSSHSKAHLEAHKSQLANMKSRMDKSVLEKFIEEDLKEKEENKQTISKENIELIADLLSEAKSHIGKKYRHGAKGPSAFDCSGFSSYVYKQFGYSLSPSSRTQYTQGKPVDRKDLRKGDLVFFTSRNSGKNVGHVGIVWEVNSETGDFKFIHASIKGVKISSFEGYYVSRYIGAKRIIE